MNNPNDMSPRDYVLSKGIPEDRLPEFLIRLEALSRAEQGIPFSVVFPTIEEADKLIAVMLTEGPPYPSYDPPVLL